MSKSISYILLVCLCITGFIDIINAKSIFEWNNNGCNYKIKKYSDGLIINRSISYINKTIEKIRNNDKIINGIYKGEVIINYKLDGHCLYYCKMNIIKNQSYAKFVMHHLDSLYEIGGILHMYCNSTLCSYGNLECITYNIRDEL